MEDIDINSEDRYLALFRNMEQAFCIIEVLFDSMGKAVDYRFLEVNPAFEKQTGLKNAVGRTMRELGPAHEDYWFRIYGDVARTRHAMHFENEAAYLTGGLWYDIFALPFGASGSHQVALLFYDITHRKKDQEALRHSEERQHSFIAASSNMIYRMSADWRRMENLSGKDFLADTLEPIIGWIDKYILPEDQPHVLTAIQKAISTKSVFELEHRVIQADGSAGWVHSRAVPLLNKQEEITEWFGTGTDITERRRIEESLHKSEEHQALLLQRMRRQKEAFQAAINGARLEDALHILASLVIEETNGEARTAFYVADDTRSRLHPVIGAGDMSEEYLKEIDGFIIGENSLACGLAVPTGHPIITADVFEEPGWKPWTFIAVKYGYRSCWSFPIKTKDNKAVGTFAMYFRTPRNATEKDIALADVVTQSAAVIISNNTDNNERKRAEQALRDSETQLKQLLKLRDEFIGVASHELKTPVTSMLAFAEVVQERLEEAGNEQDAAIIKLLNAQIERLTSLINSLLDTTRIAEGQLKMTFEPIDIPGLIQDRMGEIKRTTTHHFQFEKKNLPPVMADAERIGQVVTNLLSNAIKYSPKRNTIYVTAEQTGEHLLVSVKDEGHGIARDEQEKIFDRFYRVTTNNMDTYPGMGLGLYITAQIVERHKGRIWVESEPGKGSTFFFTLPY